MGKMLVGTANGESGSFTLVHQGFMSKESQTLDVNVVEGSDGGALKTITGSMSIAQDSDKHSYELEFKL